MDLAKIWSCRIFANAIPVSYGDASVRVTLDA